MSSKVNDNEEDEFEMDDWDSIDQSDSDDDEVLVQTVASLDSRRRLEDRLEERRLQREMQEYDFDI